MGVLHLLPRRCLRPFPGVQGPVRACMQRPRFPQPRAATRSPGGVVGDGGAVYGFDVGDHEPARLLPLPSPAERAVRPGRHVRAGGQGLRARR